MDIFHSRYFAFAALSVAFLLCAITVRPLQAQDDACHQLEIGNFEFLEAVDPALLPPWFPADFEPAGGKAGLCHSDQGVRAQLQVSGLFVGDAYTVWFVYFDDPSQCVHGGPGICGDADFFGDDPLAVLGRLDSAIATDTGRVKFEGRVRGLDLSPGSEVWLLMFGNGPANMVDGRALARQLLTPEDPTIGAPHLGIVGDPRWHPAALAVFNIE
jgi:hypothetical protein